MQDVLIRECACFDPSECQMGRESGDPEHRYCEIPYIGLHLEQSP